jgi:hypothetical protein
MTTLTLLEEAQIRNEYRALPEEQREVNEDTYVSLMEGLKHTSAPGAKWFDNVDALLEDMGLGEFKDGPAQ